MREQIKRASHEITTNPARMRASQTELDYLISTKKAFWPTQSKGGATQGLGHDAGSRNLIKATRRGHEAHGRHPNSQPFPDAGAYPEFSGRS